MSRRVAPAARPLLRTALAAIAVIGAFGAASATASRASSRTTSCTTRAQLARLSTAQLAEMSLVDPVDEGAVATLAPEVASGIGGIILLGSDATPALGAQLRALLRQAPKGRAPFVMVDEEGGSVQRLLNVVGPIPAARTMGTTMTPSAIRSLASSLGRKMRALGITMDLAPVVDLDAGPGPNATDADGTRSFSLNPAVTTPDALAFAQGLLSSGVVPVLKHFPGLGGASGNTDLEKASTVPYGGRSSAPLRPFAAGIAAGLPAVMISNAQVPKLTTLPATLSSTLVTGLLRRQMGFAGLVITDSLTALSISQSGFSLPAATSDALAAGSDEVLFNAAPGALVKENATLVTAISTAVSRGSLSRTRLLAAALDQERAKALVAAC